ncbi:hypothetical protein HDU76_007001 [Blyttiomyces sp. JEL0837]|nr:hypothetical protein HDU76_007001 [Blyttiomyces sp. JEL0837]
MALRRLGISSRSRPTVFFHQVYLSKSTSPVSTKSDLLVTVVDKEPRTAVIKGEVKESPEEGKVKIYRIPLPGMSDLGFIRATVEDGVVLRV